MTNTSKIALGHIESPVTPRSGIESMDPAEFSAKEKKLIKKIDLRLMPCLLAMIILK
jgi:hypothetical protein